MDKTSTIIIAVLIFTILLVLYYIYKTSNYYKKIEKSFSKLGFIIREDTKNIFKDSNGDFNQQKSVIQDENKQVIQEALSAAVEEQKNKSAEIVDGAYKQADSIIITARNDASNIIKQAEDQAVKLNESAVEKNSYLVESTISEYLEKNCNIEDHEKIIESIIKKIDINE
ncbi:MAG: hypothetical protein NTV30_08850 [Chloroflexi bacterium]|nr:hypothetical protein [Chloroflexota bacterium]